MLRVGIIGLGYWGPNLVRNFNDLADSKVVALCDRDTKRLKEVAVRFPNIYTTSVADEILDPGLIDAVIIVTPTNTHYSLAERALSAGIHTFVEKPLATSPQECQILIDLAEETKATLFVGHVFLYNAAVIKLKELIESGTLGNICYISSQRLNLGPIRGDVNVLWDLAPHDISIILNLIDSLPVSVNCNGLAYLKENVHDVCSLEIHFENGSMAIVHISWLDPNKVRRMTVIGDKKMAVYDDIDPMDKVRIYDKGVEKDTYTDTFGEFQISYRYGDTYSPRIKEVEPLKAECEHFIESVKQGQHPKTDGYNGMQVVKVLAAADISLQNGGGRVYLNALEDQPKPAAHGDNNA